MARQPRAKISNAEPATAGEAAAAAGVAVPSAGGQPGTPYAVLARRYRSRDFDELVGQEAIVQTLRNAVAQGRVAHAYLFTGTRGVGKTSAARLLALTLNAVPELAERDAVADAILRGDDIDVIEIDAASNTGVDNVRDLIANSTFMPARSPYRIYIIDEVHMLSKGAFNALLKTMEEPPRHVKFILCTTEAHKVPATIQSRCQRFDFRAIPAARIAEHLRSVLAREGVRCDDAVILQVARLANGSMRDALSLLDRIIAAADPGGAPIDGAVVERLLGLPESAVVHALATSIAEGDPAAALAAGEELLQTGNTYEQAIEALAEQFRTLMIAAVCGGASPLMGRFGESRDAAVALSGRFEPSQLVHMIALCENGARAARFSSAPRAIFDALLVRLALASQLIAAGGAGAPAADEKKNSAESAGGPALSGAAEAPEAAAAAGSATRPNRASAARPDGAPAAPPRGTAGDPRPDDASAPAPADASAPSGATRADAGRREAPELPPVPATEGQVDAASPRELAESLWERVAAAASTRFERAVCESLAPLALEGGRLRLSIGPVEPGLAELMRSAGSTVAELVLRAAGRRVAVVIDGLPGAGSAARGAVPSAGAGPPPSGRSAGGDGALHALVRDHPLVREACEIFDATVVSAERRAPEAPRSPGDGGD
ncbi:MAG TPA: DNA polymerase III subunit gamma/tau [Phycisphaerales bacterium]|nr:DNA polymerase III subunit gamma/tau [Phycisphaerales bacterium]HMP37673.1 DNA polymerase III subunit gamma/tau [Phycisphaerales bacterium]